jgi:hypothetical protein
MRTHGGNSPRDQEGSNRAGIDIRKLKELVNLRALDILDSRMKVVGNRTAREARVVNTHRGEKTASASWNTAKGLFCDKGDASYDGDIFNVIMRCDGVSFTEAVRIAAKEAGVDIPYRDAEATTPPASGARSKSNGKDQSRPAPNPGMQPKVPPDRCAAAGDEETPEQKIKAAQRVWADAGEVLDTPGELYLNTRKITLDREEPWLRYHPSHALYVRVEEEGRAPTYSLAGNFPALICAATIAGEGEVRAVAKIVFEMTDDCTVNTKPMIIDPRTGEPFKKNKWLRGVIEGAGIFVGQHLEGDAIVITEGVEDARCAAMAGFPAVAKMGAQTLESLTLPEHIHRVILAGDNDEAGQAGVNKAARAYHERSYAVAIVRLPEGIKDLNELLEARGVDAVRDVIAGATAWEAAPAEAETEGAAESDEPNNDALIELADDVHLPIKAEYLIKHLLGRGDIGVIYGPPGAGKSFVALHLAGCIALGRPFGGHRTRAMPVLYVGLEGEAGMRRRMTALKRVMGPFGKRLARMRLPILLCQDGAGTQGEKLLIDAVQNLRDVSGEAVGLVIIDTVWRAMAGDDENNAKDMGKFIARLNSVQKETGAAISLVHHSGKDADRGMRGSSSLLGAVDLVMKVDDKVIEVEKNKDGPDGGTIQFELRPVDLGSDDEGDPINSCVVEIQDAGGANAKRKRKRPKDHTAAGKALLQLEEAIIDKECEEVFAVPGIPNGVRVVKLETWRKRCRRKGLCPGSHPDKQEENENRAFLRAVQVLEERGWIGIMDGKVWIIKESPYARSTARNGCSSADESCDAVAA